MSGKRALRGLLTTQSAVDEIADSATGARLSDHVALPPGCLPRCLRRAAAAEYVGVGVTLFDSMVQDGRMPKPIRINARMVWDRLQLDEAVTLLRDDAGNAAADTWADIGT